MVNYFVVDLAPGFDLNDLRRQVGAHIADGTALSVLATSDLISMVEGFIATAFADMDAIQSLVVLITLAGIIDFLVSSVIERRREFALLRMAGAPSGLVVRSVILESLLLGLVAALLGAAAGAISAWIWVRFNYAVLVGYVLEMNFSWTAALTCLVLTLLTAAVTGGVTAMNAVRKSPLLGVHFD